VPFDRDGLKKILEDEGFTVVLWDKPVGELGGIDRCARPRRCSSVANLMPELEWLRSHGVKTIALYTVKSPGWTYLDPDDGVTKPVPGVLIRWAYYAGV